MNDLIVTFDHLHSAPGWGVRPGLCHRGARTFCERHGLDWSVIVAAGGIPAPALIATGDALGIALVEHAARVEAAKVAEEVSHG